MKLLGKLVVWPIQWMKALPWVAVSGAMLYAAATQWAGHWPWVEMLSHFRVLVLALCLAGCVLFLIGLSLGRVVLGLAVAVWLAWPLGRYFLPAAQPVPAPGCPPQEVTVALCHPGADGVAADRILAWDADIVVLAGPTEEFYRAHYQAFRERYPAHSADPSGPPVGLWCFTRLPVAKDLCKTRTKALGGTPACDWTLRLPDGTPCRLVAAHAPYPSGSANAETRRKVLAGLGAALEQNQGPRLVVGSLACTPFSAFFGDLAAKAGVRDTSIGHGLSSTRVSAWMPAVGLPVDHILVSDHWQVVARTLGDGPGHRSVVVRLRRVR